MNRGAPRLVARIRAGQEDLEKKYEIEHLKALGAIAFTGATNPIDAEVWLNIIEKCFKVRRYPKDQKVELAIFLL